jgi:hypothetical protein
MGSAQVLPAARALLMPWRGPGVDLAKTADLLGLFGSSLGARLYQQAIGDKT